MAALPTLSGLRVRAAQIVATLTHGKQQVVKVFPGPDGLVGAVIEDATKQRDIAWLTPHADAALAGSLLGRHGEDLTRAAKIQQGIILSPEKVLDEAAAAASRGFIAGTHGPLITAFFDPNCWYCHQLYGALAPAIAAGHVRVRFILVGTLKASSAPRAASILAASDPTSALEQNESSYHAEIEEGGYPVAAKPVPGMLAALQRNTTLFTRAGFVGTPSILYCTKGGDVVFMQGVPSNLTSFLAAAGECR